MRTIRTVIFALLLAAVSCKHTQPTTKTDPKKTTFENKPKGDDGGQMSAEKASEEEIFIAGCIEKSLGNNRRALLKFQECLEMNPKNAAANYELADIYFEEGQKDRALKYAQAATELSPANRWYKLRYADLLQENGRHDEATRIFKELSDNEPGNTELLYRYASSLQKANRNDDALNVYSKIQNLEGISDTLINCRIVAYRAKKDIAGEEKSLLELLAAKPGDLNTYYRLGDFYQQNLMTEKADDLYRKMISAFPYLAEPRLKLAASYREKGNSEKAFTEAERAFELPSSIEEKADYLRRFYPVTDSSAALTAVQKKEADSLCRVLRRVHPDKAQPYSLSANYLYADGRLKEARDQYRKAVNINGDSYEPWKRILLINDKLKDNAAQEKDCKAVLELYTTQPEPYYYLGMINYNRGDYKKAIPDLESAIDYTYGNSPFEISVKKLLIKSYRATGNDNRADDFCEEILPVDSSDYEIINGYCFSMATKLIKLYKAEQMMLRLVEKEPGNSSYLETLGFVEYRMKDFKEAKGWLAKAVAANPSSCSANERLGDAEYRLGNKESALQYWKKAAALCKENAISNTALDRKISTQSMLENE